MGQKGPLHTASSSNGWKPTPLSVIKSMITSWASRGEIGVSVGSLNPSSLFIHR